MSSSLAVDARGLVKSFKGQVAVDHLDLSVPAGARIGLLGPNGAGKTTTLLMLLGAIAPDSGDIEVAGHRLPRGRSKAMEHVGFVAGYLPLPENLTVREALSLFAGLAGIRKPQAIVSEAIEAFGLAELADKRNQELSSGQRTLVSITKAVLHRPQLLVLDEPTASLDPDMAARVRDALLEINRRDGTALLVTSHNMREVVTLCERVILMSRGKIVADGTPAAIATQFAVDDLEGAFLAVAAELGRTEMNLVRVRAVVRRHWLVLWRSPHRWFEIAFWPVMDVILWGSLGVFIAQENEASRASVPYLLAGLMLFWTFTQVQMTGSTTFMEETWTRNLLNVLTTPLKPLEYLAGTSVFGLAKLFLTLLTLTITTVLLYGFDLSAVGWSVIPIVTLLVLNGWALALVVIGLILRFGQSAEILTWGLNFVALAISGVFFPVEALPSGLRLVANVLPTTHAFAAARDVLDGKGVPWGRLGISLAGTVVALILASWFGATMLKVFRTRGFVTRYS